MARSFAQADLRDVLPGIDVPTLLLYGDNDVRTPLNVAEDLHAAIPRSRLVVLPGVGHLVNIEAGERFNPEVRAQMQAECPHGVPLPRCRCGAGNGRTIAWSHDDEFSSRDRSLTAKHTAEGRRARCRA